MSDDEQADEPSPTPQPDADDAPRADGQAPDEEPAHDAEPGAGEVADEVEGQPRDEGDEPSTEGEAAEDGEPTPDDAGKAGDDDGDHEPEGQGEAEEREASAEAEGGTPDEGATGDEDGGEEGGEQPPDDEEEAAEEEQAEPGPPPVYDGLETGLSWFGAEPFVPPVPTGYAAAEAAVGPVEAAEGATVGERKLGVRERLEARRAELDATRKWYQKVPIPVWLCMPATIFIVCWILFVARPWTKVPAPREACDPELLTATPIEDIVTALQELRVETMSPPDSWAPLEGRILRMDPQLGTASVSFKLPEAGAEGQARSYEFACDVAFARVPESVAYALRLDLGNAWAIEIRGNQAVPRAGREPGRDDFYYYTDLDTSAASRGVGTAAYEPQHEVDLKAMHWYTLRVIVEEGLAWYYVNGQRLYGAHASAGKAQTIATLTATNAQVLIRNPRVETDD